jgi:hypothetical protein
MVGSSATLPVLAHNMNDQSHLLTTTAASPATTLLSPPKPSMLSDWAKNFNLYWVAATSLAIWLFAVHTPVFWLQRQLWRRDAWLAVHIVGAGTVYFACAHNCRVTPSVFSWSWRGMTWTSRWMHIWMGRLGLVAGTIGFAIGAVLAWSRLGHAGTDLSFVVPITIGGIGQMWAQYYGYVAIRRFQSLKREIADKCASHVRQEATCTREQNELHEQEIQALQVEQREALRSHIENMISLFVFACGIPASVRIGALLSGAKDGVATTIAILAVIGVLNVLGYWYIKKMEPTL